MSIVAFSMLVGCAQHGTSSGVWVDPVLGADDAQHGTGPGAQAFRTITYALTKTGGDVHLAAGSYSAATNGELFPLVLTGEQQLIGQAGVASTGSGPYEPATFPTAMTIVLAGDANEVHDCSVTSAPPSADAAQCIQIASNGSHLIASSDLHDCGIVIDFGGFSGATLRDVTTGTGTPSSGNCLDHLGDNVRLESFSCSASNDWIFVWGANLSGCGTIVTGRVAGGSGGPLPNLDGPC